MKVDGWLEKAQFENIASSSPTPTSTGRVYIDTSAPAAAVPRIYNGSAWLPFLLGQSSPLVSQNSGTSVTVNWATGVNQQVVLTGHSIISFQNPQAGQIHTLVVTQKELVPLTTTTPYIFRFNFPDQDSRRMAYQPSGALQSGESQVFSWFYKAAVKAAYATIPATFTAGPATFSTLATGIDVWPGQAKGNNSDPGLLFFGRTSSPFGQSVRTYDEAKFTWTKLDISTPTAAAAQLLGVQYHPAGHTLFGVSGTSPFIQAWTVDIYGVPNQTAYANPGTLPVGAGKCLAVNPSGSHVVVGHATTPFMSVYPLLQVAFGAKVADPSTLPTGSVTGTAWSPVGDYLAVGTGVSPCLQVWAFDAVPSAGSFGAASANPSVLPGGGPAGGVGKPICWHPSGNFIAMGMTASPYFYVVPFNRATGAFGIPLTITAGTGPAATVNCIQFSPCGNYLAMGNSANLFIFDFSAQTISTTPIAYDVAGPGVQVNDIVFSPGGDFIHCALNTTLGVQTFPMPRVAKNYLKLVD